jgi:multiple sugar transport system permease protein
MSTTAAPEQKKPQVGAVSPRRRALRPYLLVLPSLLLTIGILYPFGLGLFYTFFNYAAATPNPDFVGLQNYVAIFTSSEFWQSAWVTLRYAVSTTVVETLLGVGVALLLFRGSVSGRILERVLIVPLMIAPVIATIMWSLMLQPTVGVINYMLSPLGLGGVEWTDSPRGAFLSAVVIDAWIFTPFVALLALAGMRSLPRDPFEAAAVDGAGYWYTFRKLMLPMLWPYILVAVIFRFMDSLKMFDVIYALTRGGPGDSMMVLQVRGYQEAILYTNFSVGLTYTIVIWAAVFIATRLLVGIFGRAQARAAGP